MANTTVKYVVMPILVEVNEKNEVVSLRSASCKEATEYVYDQSFDSRREADSWLDNNQ
jgi:hypothetical protein